MNRPVHFEIHAEDPDRASKFYSEVFGWTIKKWDGGGMPYWLVTTGAQDTVGPDGKPWPGINGGIVKRMGAAPAEGQAVNAYVCTMDVSSVDDTLAKIITVGGSLALAKMPIPGMGWLAYAKDVEGNIFGIMQTDTNAK
jgi:predicted enzyme related to lactoylglutathione lyase